MRPDDIRAITITPDATSDIDLVRLNIKAINEVVKAHGDALKQVNKAIADRVSTRDLAAALQAKVGVEEMRAHISELESVVDNKADARDTSSILETLRKDVHRSGGKKANVEDVQRCLNQLEARIDTLDERIAEALQARQPPPPPPRPPEPTEEERSAEVRLLVKAAVDGLRTELRREVAEELARSTKVVGSRLEQSERAMGDVEGWLAAHEARADERMQREVNLAVEEAAHSLTAHAEERAAAAALQQQRRASFHQATIIVTVPRRGCHLITDMLLESVPAISDFQCGVCHLFVQHTACSLSVNVIDDASVREDMEAALAKLVPSSWVHDGTFRHTIPASDRRHTMPGHVKAALLGGALAVPVVRGSLALGEWQGIYLNDHRDGGGALRGAHRRSIVVTIQGELAERSRSGNFPLYR